MESGERNFNIDTSDVIVDVECIHCPVEFMFELAWFDWLLRKFLAIILFFATNDWMSQRTPPADKSVFLILLSIIVLNENTLPAVRVPKRLTPPTSAASSPFL